jgi:TDG/mug DNA glycosylase family protein
MRPYRPTKEEIQAANGKSVSDVIAPNLRVLFVGINPGLYTAAIGHHFGRPGNRFWPALFASGFTDRLLSPYDEQELLANGLGITNLVNRATAAADELSTEELSTGGRELQIKVQHFRPRSIAVLGIGAYRSAFNRPQATLGPQPETLSGAILWVLPNPSGLNAHYRPVDFARLFEELRLAVEGK